MLRGAHRKVDGAVREPPDNGFKGWGEVFFLPVGMTKAGQIVELSEFQYLHAHHVTACPIC